MASSSSSSDRLTERLARKAHGLAATLSSLDRLCGEADMLLRVLGGMDADGSNNSIPGCAASLADATAPLRDRALALRTAQRNLEAVAQVADTLVEHLSVCRRLSPRVASAAVTFPGPGSPRLAGRRWQKNAMLLLLRDEEGGDNNLAASQMAAESFVSDVERLGQACVALLQPLSTTTTTTTRRRRHSTTSHHKHQQSAAATHEAARPVVVQALSALEQGRARLAEELAAALAALSSLSSSSQPQPQPPPPLLLRRAAAVLLQHELLLLVSRPMMSTAEDEQQGDHPPPPTLRRFRSKSSAAAAAQRSTLVSRCGAARASALVSAMREGGDKSSTTVARRLPNLALAWRVARASAAAAEASGLRAAVEAAVGDAAASTPTIDRYYQTAAAYRPTSVSFASLDAVVAVSAAAEADDSDDDDNNPKPALPPLPPAPPALLLPLPGALARYDPSTDAALSSAAAAWLRNLDALSSLLPAERALADAVFCSSASLPPSSATNYTSASSTTAAAAASCAAAAAIGALSALAQQGHTLVAALRRAGHDRAAPLLVDVACALEARLPVLEAAVRAAVVKGVVGGRGGEDYGGGDGDSSDGGSGSGGGGGGNRGGGGSTDEEEEDEENDNHHRHHHNRVRVSYFDDAGGGGGGGADDDDNPPPPTAAAQASLADLRAVQKQAERAAGEAFRGYEAALLAAGAAAACSGCDTLFLPLAADGSVHPLAADAARYARQLLFQSTKTTTTPSGGAAAVLFGGGAGAAFAPLPSTAAAAAQRELLERQAAKAAARKARGGGSGSDDGEEEEEEKEQHEDDLSRSQPLPPHERALAEAVGRLLHAALAALEAKARAALSSSSSSSSSVSSRHALAALFLANNAAVLLAAGEPEEEEQRRAPPTASWSPLRLEADAHAEAFHRALWGPALQLLEDGQDTTTGTFFARVDEAIQMQRSWLAVEQGGLRERLVRRAREELKGALRAARKEDGDLQRQLEARLDEAALLSGST